MAINEDDIYRWRGDEAQLVAYPYVVDDNDIAAFNAYAKRRFLPPQRPDGFLDDHERATWERWKHKALSLAVRNEQSHSGRRT